MATVAFFCGTTQVYPLQAVDSGNAGDSWGPEGAVMNNGSKKFWGGRKDKNGEIWIGGEFPPETVLTSVRVEETSLAHRAKDPKMIKLEKKRGSSDWRDAQQTENYNPGEQVTQNSAKEEERITKVRWQPIGPKPKDQDLVTTPSKALSGKVHGVCYKSQLQSQRTETFVPDETFYYSENCEGLWVCVSKACGRETLKRVCQLIRKTVPQQQRELWGNFSSPKWARDPGPMRVIVLDNRANEQSGCIPELQDGSRGRNQTMCPFVFTSREDFHEGVGGGSWCKGRLTLHELTHGSDMVIRQLVDPYFHDEVGELWSKHRDKFQYTQELTRTTTVFCSKDNEVNERGKFAFCYAAENRDEFLAECHCIVQGLHATCKDYKRCKLSTPDELRSVMPDVYQLLAMYFLLS